MIRRANFLCGNFLCASTDTGEQRPCDSYTVRVPAESPPANPVPVPPCPIRPPTPPRRPIRPSGT
jgi:hypothetical protein